MDQHKQLYFSYLITAVLAFYVIVQNMLLLSHGRALLLNEFKLNADKELTIVALHLKEDVLLQNYAKLESFLQNWTDKHSSIISLRAISANGFTIYQLHKSQTSQHPYTMTRNIQVDGKIFATLQASWSLSAIEEEIARLTTLVVAATIIWAALLVVIFTWALRYFVFHPLENSAKRQEVLTNLLKLGLTPLPLSELLYRALEEVVRTHNFGPNTRGIIFLNSPSSNADTPEEEAQPRTLHLETSYGLSEIQVQGCRSVPYGACMCGIAAKDQKIVFSAPDTPERAVRMPSEQWRVSYSLPMVSEGETIGVIVIYPDFTHKMSSNDEAFLHAIANTVTGIVVRKQTETALEASNKTLESRVQERTKELRNANEKLQLLAHNDHLTGLANRAHFHITLSQAIDHAAAKECSFALLFIDLNRFKEVNDLHGHDVGDLLLIAVAQRLKKLCREQDTIARLGGDEFVVLLQGPIRRQETEAIAKRVMAELLAPYHEKNRTLTIGASVGIAMYPDHAKSAESLLALADKAMYRVKRQGNSEGGIQFIDEKSTRIPH